MRHGRAEWENHATKARHDHHHMCLKKKSTNNGKKKDPKRKHSQISPHHPQEKAIPQNLPANSAPKADAVPRSTLVP